MIATVTLNPSLDEWVQLPTLRVGALNRAGQFTRYVGGKGINVSRVVHELGGRTIAYTLLGGDDGHIVRRMMRQLGVPCEAVSIQGSTRNNYKIVAIHPPQFTEINTPGPCVSPQALDELHARFMRHRKRITVIVLSGSLSPGVPTTIYQRWMRWCHEVDIPVVLDTSGPALAHGLRGRPWLIKPNRHEAEELLGRSLKTMHAVVAAARELVVRGPAHVLLSLGADGAVLASASSPEIFVAIPPRVRVRSAVGAGDSLVGGFVHGWIIHKRLPEALRLGIACGGACAMTPGTELCHLADVRRLLPRVTLRFISRSCLKPRH